MLLQLCVIGKTFLKFQIFENIKQVSTDYYLIYGSTFSVPAGGWVHHKVGHESANWRHTPYQLVTVKRVALVTQPVTPPSNQSVTDCSDIAFSGQHGTLETVARYVLINGLVPRIVASRKALELWRAKSNHAVEALVEKGHYSGPLTHGNMPITIKVICCLSCPFSTCACTAQSNLAQLCSDGWFSNTLQ